MVGVTDGFKAETGLCRELSVFTVVTDDQATV